MLFGDLLIGDRFFDPVSGDEWIKVDFTKAYQVTGTDACGLDEFNENDYVWIINDYKKDLKASLEQLMLYSDNELVIGADGHQFNLFERLNEL